MYPMSAIRSTSGSSAGRCGRHCRCRVRLGGAAALVVATSHDIGSVATGLGPGMETHCAGLVHGVTAPHGEVRPMVLSLVFLAYY